MSDKERAADLRKKAELCRTLARLLSLREEAERLLQEAEAYEAQARAIEARAQRPPDGAPDEPGT